jgi:hypothetical protein
MKNLIIKFPNPGVFKGSLFLYTEFEFGLGTTVVHVFYIGLTYLEVVELYKQETQIVFCVEYGLHVS